MQAGRQTDSQFYKVILQILSLFSQRFHLKVIKRGLSRFVSLQATCLPRLVDLS